VLSPYPQDREGKGGNADKGIVCGESKSCARGGGLAVC